jgi:hypothetical protein
MKKSPRKTDLALHLFCYSVASQPFIDIQKVSLLRTSAPQRRALAAVGGRVDSPSKREKPKARKMPKKRGAYPPSAARCVGRTLGTQASPISLEPIF